MARHSDKTLRVLVPATVTFAVLAFIAMALPPLIFFLMISQVGIPFAFVLMCAPAALLVLLLLQVFYRITPGQRWLKHTSAAICTAVCLTVPPLWLNAPVKQNALALASADHNDLTLPLKSSSIGIKKKPDYSRRMSQCDGFCLHALLTGATDRFLVALTEKPATPPTGQEPAIEFSLQRRDVCPSVEFEPEGHALDLPADLNRAQTANVRAVDLMQLRMIDGECLIERDALLGEAEIIVTQGDIKRVAEHAKVSINPWIDTVSALRIAVYSRAPDGSFQEVFRQTEVDRFDLAPILLPVMAMRQPLEFIPALWRRQETINPDSPSPQRRNWGQFLTETLGFNLALTSADMEEAIVERLEAAWSEDRPPTVAEWKAFSSYVVRDNGRAGQQFPSAIDRLSLTVMSDLRYPPPPHLFAVASRASKSGSKRELQLLARAFLIRAKSGVTWSEALNVNVEVMWRTLADAMPFLPRDVLEPYMQDFFLIARDPDAQRYGWKALSHLGEFGEAAVPTLLYLVETGVKGGKDRTKLPEYEHPYTAGLTGLCEAGAAASSALHRLRELQHQGALPMYRSSGSYGLLGRLTITTLNRLGMPDEELWTIYSSEAIGPQRSDFDMLIKNIKAGRTDCR